MVRGLWLHISSVPLVSAAAQSRSSVLASPRIGCDNALDAWSLLRLRIFIINDLLCVCVPLLCLLNLTFNILTSDQRSSLAHSLWKHVEDWINLKHLEATFLPSRWSAARLAKHHWADAVVILRRITWHKVRGHGHSSRAKTAAAEMPSERKRRGDVEHFIELFFSFMTHINTFCWFFWLLVILWRLNHQHVVDKFNMPWLSGLEIDCYDLTVGTWIISPCRMCEVAQQDDHVLRFGAAGSCPPHLGSVILSLQYLPVPVAACGCERIIPMQ